MNSKKITSLYPLEEQEIAPLSQMADGASSPTGQDTDAQRKTYLFKTDDSAIQSMPQKDIQPEALAAPHKKSTLFKCKICRSTVTSNGTETL